jgi:hypothetical protein
MKETMKNILAEFSSKETWERVRWFMRFKSRKEAPYSTLITKKDIVPIIICTAIPIIILVVGFLIVIAIWGVSL